MNIFQVDGTLITIIDGVEYEQPANGTYMSIGSVSLKATFAIQAGPSSGTNSFFQYLGSRACEYIRDKHTPVLGTGLLRSLAISKHISRSKMRL